LNAHSKGIQSAAAVRQRTQAAQQDAAQFVTDVNQLVDRMQRFDLEADAHLQKFPNAEKRYQDITAKMTEYVERERQLAGNPNAATARGQIAVVVNQGALQTEQLHIQQQTLQTSLDTNVKPILNELSAMERRCRGNTSTSDVTDACGHLESADGPFRQKYDATVAGLEHIEQVYQREHNTQQELIQKAQSLE
jgi:hypothetical protein